MKLIQNEQKRKPLRIIIKNEFKIESSAQVVIGRIHIF